MAGTTEIYDEGAVVLVSTGWTSYVTHARLWTDSNVEVDEQSVTFTYNTSEKRWKPTGDIVFDVAAGTQDVSYVTIGSSTVEYYEKVFATLYDFTTLGTLTIDSWAFNITGTSLNDDGKEALFGTGFLGIATAKLYTSGSAVLLDTQSVTFEVTQADGTIEPTANIIFDVTSGIAYSIQLLISTTVVYNRTLDSTYPFTTPGTLTVDSWAISF